jgi:hypothetical protein
VQEGQVSAPAGRADASKKCPLAHCEHSEVLAEAQLVSASLQKSTAGHAAQIDACPSEVR